LADILKRLKLETAEWHSRIETLVPVFDREFTLVDYQRLLARFYGFYCPFEKAVGSVPGVARLLPDLADRFKVPALAADLRWLGSIEADLPRLPQCSLLPRLDSISTLAGALYVTEGSTLGGQFITRHLRGSLGVVSGAGGSFFAGYGDRTGSRWKTFTAAVESWASPHNEAAMIQSALTTFRMLFIWLAEEQESRQRAAYRFAGTGVE